MVEDENGEPTPELLRELALEHLGETAHLAGSFESRMGEPDDFDGVAAYVVAGALVRARDWCGRELMERATLSNVRIGGLEQLAKRLRLVAPILDTPSVDGFSIYDLISEIEAVAAGDGPRLLARRPEMYGTKPNAFRLMRWRLQALMWWAYLDGRADKPKDRNKALQDAFGADSDAIRKWRGPCEEAFGADMVAHRLSQAERAGRAAGDPSSIFRRIWPMDTRTLDEAGKAYLEELRQSHDGKDKR